MLSAQLLATSDQVFALFVLESCPPGSELLCAQFLATLDQDFELFVPFEPGSVVNSAQSFDFSDQDFELFVLEFVPPGSLPLCAHSFALSLKPSDSSAYDLEDLVFCPPGAEVLSDHFFDSSDHDLEDLVSCPPGVEVLSAHFFDSSDQVLELYASTLPGSGDNPD